ncbi:hypothetical protein BDK92_2425 [Micromonospora pisi]|uniref:Uncharacterized protein n=1 Tax=Micromonospora pisi TaxID=589240 RepID=A0A495JHS6_9ACTN|nr:hypothetical protein [Micromonospora pisi]RKR88118.1 hypothetical protein BDK92_2425 [Micromonospora pisi]
MANKSRPARRPEPGDLVVVGKAASVQFGGEQGFTFRITAVDKRLTYPGWVWLTGYVLDAKGEAVTRREIFVLIEGLRRLTPRGRE